MEFTIVDRIRQVMEHVELSPSFFADEIGVQRSSVSHILSGRNKPSLEMVTRLLNRFPEINPVWIITGNGEMVQLNLFEESPPQPEKKGIKPTPPKKVAPPMTREPIVVEPIEGEVVDVATLPMFPELEQEATAPVTPTAEVNAQPAPAPVTAPPVAAPTPTPSAPSFPVQTLATPGKKIQKIIIFYDDKTFSVYEQEI